MPQAKLITPVSMQVITKKRVAAYCRVSSNSADQLNSYSVQIDAYTKLIKSKKDWELVGIFADEGISGMKAGNRQEFQRMIRLCELRQLDLIITKSVSRFARNVKEALEYVRKLKLLGVGIQFEKEGIYTLSLGDEMLLNTFTAIAQEESQSISQHLRLSIVKRMELGEYVDSNAPYGYRLQNNELAVYEPEAKIVRYIYNLYLAGCSITGIARELTAKGIPTKLGKEKWSHTIVGYILTNERYVGDCRYHKKYRDATVPFKQMKNRGEVDMYYATGTHTPLIDRDVFDKVQNLFVKRREHFAKAEPDRNIYPLTSRIRCSECGSFYRRKIRGATIKWVCSQHHKDTKSCDSNYYYEEQIYAGLITMINKLRFGDEHIVERIIAKLESAVARQKRNNKVAMELSLSVSQLNAKLHMLDQIHTKGYLATDVYQSQARGIKNQLKELNAARQNVLDSQIAQMLQNVRRLKCSLDGIDEPLEEFDEKLVFNIVTDIMLNKQDEMTITVVGGLKFTELI